MTTCVIDGEMSKKINKRTLQEWWYPNVAIGRASLAQLQNKVRLKVLPEQLTLFVNTSVTFKNCIIQ